MLVGQKEYNRKKEKHGITDTELYIETGVSRPTIIKAKTSSVTYDVFNKLVNGVNRIIERRKQLK